MNKNRLSVLALLVVVGSFAVAADPAKDAKSEAPAGMSPQDMQACAAAATPGKMHEFLAKGIGAWNGKNSMWMPGGGDEPMKSESTSTVTAMLDGRFIKVEVDGEMPGGMGPFNGFGIYGFDNVSQEFVSTWIDNMGTGMMTGTGKLSEDGKTLTWNYTYNCPLQKKPVPLREVETITGEKTKKLEMFGQDPKTGKEFKMMTLELTKQ